MRLKAAIKVSQVEHKLDGRTFIYPNASRKSDNVKWTVIVADHDIPEVGLKGDVKIIRLEDTTERNICPDVENSYLKEVVNCGKNLLWNCPVKYIIHIIGHWDWEPD